MKTMVLKYVGEKLPAEHGLLVFDSNQDRGVIFTEPGQSFEFSELTALDLD